MEKPDPQPLDIIIVGAGIGGLATAIGLCREGHNVRVFERSKFAKEVGAALAMSSNLDGPLKKLEFHPEEFGANEEAVRTHLTKDGHCYFEHDLSDSPARLIHRVDLHQALKEAALKQGAEIHLSSRITTMDPDAGSITLDTGEVFTADVVIGADGVHSLMRKYIVPSAAEPSQFYRSMFRMLIPCPTLAASPDTKIFLNPPGKMTVYTSDDGRRIVCYPCRSNTVMNVGTLFPTSMLKTYTNTQDIKEHMTELFADFHHSAQALIAAADEPSLWKLYDLPALETWCRGRAVLIGDAAHATLPYAAQGAAQAIEDAVTITVLLGKGTRAEEVHDRLELFFRIRYERASYIQEFSRTADQLTPTNSVTPKVTNEEFFDKVYNHNACAFAEQKLQEHLKG